MFKKITVTVVMLLHVSVTWAQQDSVILNEKQKFIVQATVQEIEVQLKEKLMQNLSIPDFDKLLLQYAQYRRDTVIHYNFKNESVATVSINIHLK